MTLYQIGNIFFNNPILNSSSCWSMYQDQITELIESELGGVIAKTCTPYAKNGNLEPTYYKENELNVCFNSKGLPNNGYEYYKNISKSIKSISKSKPFILSMAYVDNNDNNDYIDKFKLMITDYNNLTNTMNCQQLVEINMSCPNIDSEIVPYDINKFELFFEKIRETVLLCKNLLFGIKLPPYIDKKLLGTIAHIICKNSDIIHFLTLCNSIPNCLPISNGGEYMLSTKFGGMSGKFNKYIAISNVKSFSDIFKMNDCKIKIIGSGGIEFFEDVVDYFKMGADFVQLGSCFYDNNTNRLNINKIDNLISLLKEKKII